MDFVVAQVRSDDYGTNSVRKSGESRNRFGVELRWLDGIIIKESVVCPVSSLRFRCLRCPLIRDDVLVRGPAFGWVVEVQHRDGNDV